ncbi:molybdate ABC transporter substrate-binding protein [Algicella marina]|uniref:Molybdate ABC transporter substrate-binding protein n=1 Tax=Algicella marina TaxID=2683284 RepID=A0A6P1T4V0_9RHOB|nr:molybdate ABC transporter substrate-binding protein [Algicella marina]QHQ36775.1 molybdate ABC transporter substrate-binding protein [Algicella marina]
MSPIHRLLLFLALILAQPARAEEPVTVFAAASMKTVLDGMLVDWPGVRASYAGSATLARQIGLGAPADIFVSANADWMDALQADGMLSAASRVDVAGNGLVIVGPAGAAPLELSDLPARLGEGRLAIGQVEAVPAGIYGKVALQHLNLWETVKERLAEGENVRAALALVARGEAPLGLVYATDAMVGDVAVVARLPEESHPPIRYPAAVIAGRERPEVMAFFAYMTGPEGAARFREAGFLPPPE